MGHELTGEKALHKIKALIAELDIGMFTTRGQDGLPRSRPMSSNGDVSEDGTLWFFARQSSQKINEIASEPTVHIAFSDPSKNIYVSVTGTADVLADKATIEKHWKPSLKAWFPKGTDEADIAVIKVTLQVAEYWETPNSLVSHTLSFAKSLVTGTPANPGDHGITR